MFGGIPAETGRAAEGTDRRVRAADTVGISTRFKPAAGADILMGFPVNINGFIVMFRIQLDPVRRAALSADQTGVPAHAVEVGLTVERHAAGRAGMIMITFIRLPDGFIGSMCPPGIGDLGTAVPAILIVFIAVTLPAQICVPDRTVDRGTADTARGRISRVAGHIVFFRDGIIAIGTELRMGPVFVYDRVKRMEDRDIRCHGRAAARAYARIRTIHIMIAEGSLPAIPAGKSMRTVTVIRADNEIMPVRSDIRIAFRAMNDMNIRVFRIGGISQAFLRMGTFRGRRRHQHH